MLNGRIEGWLVTVHSEGVKLLKTSAYPWLKTIRTMTICKICTNDISTRKPIILRSHGRVHRITNRLYHLPLHSSPVENIML